MENAKRLLFGLVLSAFRDEKFTFTWLIKSLRTTVSFLLILLPFDALHFKNLFPPIICEASNLFTPSFLNPVIELVNLISQSLNVLTNKSVKDLESKLSPLQSSMWH